MTSHAVDAVGKEVKLRSKHPLRGRKPSGPRRADATPELYLILENASKVLELVEKGELSVHPPQIVQSLSAKRKGQFSPTEEKELAYRIHTWGDIEARNKLAMSAYGMAILEARKASASGKFRFEDLLQEAILGLMRATETFDPTMNTRFITYATEWIRAHIGRFKQRDSKHLALPVEGAPLQTLPSGKRMRPRQPIISVNTPANNDDNDDEVGDTIASHTESAEEELIRKETSSLIRDGLSKAIEDLKSQLDDKNIERLRKIVELRLLADEPETLEKIGEATNCSREAIRILENRLKKTLETNLKGKLV